MPELPEVETVKNAIEPIVNQSTLKKLIIRVEKLRWPISNELYQLNNQKIISLKRRAKYLIFDLTDGYIVIHLGMTGTLNIVKADVPLTKHDHVDLVLDNDYILRYNDPRKFGCILWTNRLEDFAQLQKLGPEPFDNKFNFEYLYVKMHAHKIPIKNLLMQNPVVVGIGNIYASEILFLSKIHPLTPSNQLTLQQSKLLVKNIRLVLRKAIKLGGTSIRDFQSPEGKRGYFVQQLNVYGRKGENCHICQHIIKSLVIAQRNSFFLRKLSKIKITLAFI